VRRPIALTTTVALATLVGISSACRGQFEAPAVVSVDATTTYQHIVGWEATAQVGQGVPTFPIDPPFARYKDRLFDLIVNDLGINRVRLEVRSGSESNQDTWELYRSGRIDHRAWRCRRYATVNDNADPHTLDEQGFHFSELDRGVEYAVLPLRKRVEANGERLFVNLCYVAFTDQICGGLSYHHSNPEEYAEFILATFLHLRGKYGLVPNAVEVILEPDNTAFWRGPQIGAAMVATARRLAEHGFQPKFIAPSNTNMTSAVGYFDDMIKVPGVSRLLGEFSYHRYSGVSESSLRAIGVRAARHFVQTAMLEWIGATHEDLHADLKVGQNSAWARYIIGDANQDPGGLYYQLDLRDRDRPVVMRVPATGFLRQYFKFVRAGARRIEATSSRADVDPLAFVNTNGSFVVVLKSRYTGSIQIRGLPSGTYGVSYTVDGVTTVDTVDIQIPNAQLISVDIPGSGVLTVYRRTAVESPTDPPGATN